MNAKELITWGTEQLEKETIEDASLDAWYLFEFVSGLTRVDYILKMNEEVDAEQRKEYEALIAKRKSHIPLQHLTGVQAFMGYDFFVNEHVLIPRQDTETVLEEVLNKVKKAETVLDLCTGSGCIGISLALLGQYKEVFLSDLSNDALLVAEKNAQTLLGKEKEEMLEHLHIVQGNLFESIPEGSMFDLIVSNPPYIPTSVCETLMEEVREHEPRMALDGEEDGLFFYRKIIEEARNYLKQGGWIFFEIGHDQGEALRNIFANYEEYSEVQIKKDLAGLDRIAFAKYCEKADTKRA